MENSKDKNNKDSTPANEEGVTKDVTNNEINVEELLKRQGSEEQKMKEKYISEVSKIEDAPGNGGIEKTKNDTGSKEE